MTNPKPGETLETLRAQIRAAKAAPGDPSKRIEALIDFDIFRFLAADMFELTGNEYWRAFNQHPSAAMPDRVVTGQQIDGVDLIVSNAVSGMRVTATPWPRSTFS